MSRYLIRFSEPLQPIEAGIEAAWAFPLNLVLVEGYTFTAYKEGDFSADGFTGSAWKLLDAWSNPVYVACVHAAAGLRAPTSKIRDWHFFRDPGAVGPIYTVLSFLEKQSVVPSSYRVTWGDNDD